MKVKFRIIIVLIISLLLVFPNKIQAKENFDLKNNIYIADIISTTQSSTLPDFVSTNESICDNTLTDFINDYWKLVMIFTPPLAILMISVDFFKAITSSDAEAVKKAANSALKRTLAFVLLLFLPFIINTLFGWFGLPLCF